ncbi:MAG: hypothetical protein ACQES8_04550 [Thermodesulfobacteriota bacterium]
MRIRKSRKEGAQEFWRNAAKAQENVEQWPEWKRNVRLTRYSEALLDKKEVKENCEDQ